MKVKMINRSESDYTKRRAGEAHRVFHNSDPKLHPFEDAKEIKRAINAAKLERIFAKPFVSAYSHSDAVTALTTNPKRLNCLVSGTADGVVWQWDLANRRCLRRFPGHSSVVKGLSITPDGDGCVSCSIDGTLKLWKIPIAPFEERETLSDVPLFAEFTGTESYRCLDHHWHKRQFLTGSSVVEVWDHRRTHAIQRFSWGSESITAIKFNPVEVELIGATATDRSTILYDLRSETPIRKLVMQTRCNALSWNPMEAMTFVVANEDCNLYTYDLRRLDSSRTVHKGFVSSVMDVDYSPSGREFVAAGYDRTLRLFEEGAQGSWDVYFTQRMSRLSCVRFSRDGVYVFSGSEDMNVRTWKAHASEQLGVQLPPERKKQAYNSALLERYRHVEEVRKVKKSLRLPRPIRKAQKIRRIIQTNDKKKLENKRKHSKPGSVPHKPERKRKIVGTIE